MAASRTGAPRPTVSVLKLFPDPQEATGDTQLLQPQDSKNWTPGPARHLVLLDTSSCWRSAPASGSRKQELLCGLLRPSRGDGCHLMGLIKLGPATLVASAGGEGIRKFEAIFEPSVRHNINNLLSEGLCFSSHHPRPQHGESHSSMSPYRVQPCVGTAPLVPAACCLLLPGPGASLLAPACSRQHGACCLEHPVPASALLVPASSTACCLEHQVHASAHMVPCLSCLMPRTSCLVPGASCHVPPHSCCLVPAASPWRGLRQQQAPSTTFHKEGNHQSV